jgi:hypothetical protein
VYAARLGAPVQHCESDIATQSLIAGAQETVRADVNRSRRRDVLLQLSIPALELTMSFQKCAARALAAAIVVACGAAPAAAQNRFGYRVLSTSKTSTMQKEMQEAAEAGFRFADVMGGDTAIGGSEVVVVMARKPDPAEWEYRLLATNKTSTLQKELNEAGEAGFDYRGQTQFKSAFGGKEVVVILERPKDPGARIHFQYQLLATSKTSTMQKELSEAAERGFEFVGLTVGKTALGGDEVVSILRRQAR